MFEQLAAAFLEVVRTGRVQRLSPSRSFEVLAIFKDQSQQSAFWAPFLFFRIFFPLLFFFFSFFTAVHDFSGIRRVPWTKFQAILPKHVILASIGSLMPAHLRSCEENSMLCLCYQPLVGILWRRTNHVLCSLLVNSLAHVG